MPAFRLIVTASQVRQIWATDMARPLVSDSRLSRTTVSRTPHQSIGQVEAAHHQITSVWKVSRVAASTVLIYSIGNGYFGAISCPHPLVHSH
jgi:hypothetical protein